MYKTILSTMMIMFYVAKQRSILILRINFPWICALFFEEVLDVVIYELFGWDLVEEAP